MPNPIRWQMRAVPLLPKLKLETDCLTPGVGSVYSPRTPGIASLSEDRLCPAPDVGQDSVVVLLEAGLDRDAIDELIRAGAVRQAKS